MAATPDSDPPPAEPRPPQSRDSLTRMTIAEADGPVAEVSQALGELQKLPHSRRGRILIRSALVGFVLVFAWIGGIVYWQWRDNRKPDFRSLIESQLRLLRQHKYNDVYREASPRFQELVRFETFVDRMDDIEGALGAFREISSVMRTEVNRGPGGLTSWIRFRVLFDKGLALGAMSFHRTGGQWRLLHYDVQLPPEIAKFETTESRRKARSAAPPEVTTAALAVLEALRADKYRDVWDAAMPVFQQAISPQELSDLNRSHVAEIGRYRRVISANATMAPNSASANYDAIAEFEKATVRLSLSFARSGPSSWSLTSYQLALPMPRVQNERLPSDEELRLEMQQRADAEARRAAPGTSTPAVAPPGSGDTPDAPSPGGAAAPGN